MRTIIQRVTSASVQIGGKPHATIGSGLLVLAGFDAADHSEEVNWMAHKVLNLRLFNDEQGVPNYSVVDQQGSILVVSQFTLHALTKKGNRPSYIKAARPETAIPLYNEFVDVLKQQPGITIATGVFGADMQVHLVNDGPVTIFIDSLNRM